MGGRGKGVFVLWYVVLGVLRYVQFVARCLVVWVVLCAVERLFGSVCCLVIQKWWWCVCVLWWCVMCEGGMNGFCML